MANVWDVKNNPGDPPYKYVYVVCRVFSAQLLAVRFIVQQRQWDKGFIFRDTSTGGTTFSNLYMKLISGVSSFQNWKLEVSTPMAENIVL